MFKIILKALRLSKDLCQADVEHFVYKLFT